MKICQRCVLPESFPGVSFDRSGVCNYCRSEKAPQELREKKLACRKKFEGLLDELRGRRPYDGLMSLSGGKDSTFTLGLLKRDFDLELLAFTFDNGFLPDQTVRNIRQVTENLGIDHLYLKPSFALLKKLFVKCSEQNIYSDVTLRLASTICTTCMALVKFSLLRLAVEKRIPFMFFGWSPGQIPITSSITRNNPQMVKAMQRAVYEPLSRVSGPMIGRFFLEDEHFDRASDFPWSVSPLAFLDYDDETIADEVAKLGWVRPVGLDANSSNCLLNSYANVIHKRRHGFHPYAFELAKLVREGYLERGRALEKIGQKEDPTTVRKVKKRLEL